MAYILNIETATRNCSVSIAKDGQTLVCIEVAEEGYSHAEKLHVFVEQALLESQLTFKNLSAIAVSQGPGSYTGLRIGVSAAKGLCFALNIPLVAVDTLAILAQSATVDSGLIIPMIDARRMEVYSAVFNAQHEKIREVQAEILTAESFYNYEGPIYFLGDCAQKSKTVLQRENFIFLDELVFPSARHMELLSFAKYEVGEVVDVAYFEPYYLKDFMITSKK